MAANTGWPIPDKKVVQTLNVQTGRSNRLKFSPDGKLVLVSDLGNNALLVLDAASRKEVKRLNLGRQPEGILLVPDGSCAYVAAQTQHCWKAGSLLHRAASSRWTACMKRSQILLAMVVTFFGAAAPADAQQPRSILLTSFGACEDPGRC